MNLPYDATEREVEDLIKPHAKNGIKEISFARDRSGLARGFGFVYLNDPSEV